MVGRCGLRNFRQCHPHRICGKTGRRRRPRVTGSRPFCLMLGCFIFPADSSEDRQGAGVFHGGPLGAQLSDSLAAAARAEATAFPILGGGLTVELRLWVAALLSAQEFSLRVSCERIWSEVVNGRAVCSGASSRAADGDLEAVPRLQCPRQKAGMRAPGRAPTES